MDNIFDLIKRKETSKFYNSIIQNPDCVNLKDDFGNTPLMTSCILGNNQYVSALLRFKSDPLIINRIGVNSLALAAYSGNYYSVSNLLGSRSYMMYQTSIVPPLCAAVMSGNLEIVKIFSSLNPGPDKIKTLQGVTPLMLSLLYNHPIITEYFHTCGLSDTKNAFRQTSIDIKNYLNFNMNSSGKDIHISITPTLLEEIPVFKYPEPLKTGTGKHNKRSLASNKRRSFSPYMNSTRLAFKELSPNISPIPTSKDKMPIKPRAFNPIKKMHISPKVVVRTPPAIKKNLNLAVVDLDRRLSIESILIDIGMEKYIQLFQMEEIDLQVFLTMDTNDLCKIGIENVSDREKMFDVVKQF